MSRYRREEATTEQTDADAEKFIENTVAAVNASATKLYKQLQVEKKRKSGKA